MTNARIPDLDPRHVLKLTLIVVDETTGTTIVDAFGGGEDATIGVRSCAALLRAVADDLLPPGDWVPDE